MNLMQLKYFSVLAKTQHVTAAAKELSISPPALSNSISALEEELGVKLFNRVGRRIILNSIGSEFLLYTDAALEKLQEGCDRMEAIRRQLNKTITVGVTSPAFFQQLFDHFHKTNGTIKLEIATIQPMDTIDQALAFKYDFFLGVLADIQPQQFQYIPLWEEPLVAVVSVNHRLSKNIAVMPNELRQETIISPGDSFPSSHKCVIDFCQDAGIPQKQIRILDLFFRAKAVEEGAGVGISTAHGYRANFLASKNTICIPIIGTKMTRKQVLAWRPRKLSAADTIFLDYAKWYFSAIESTKTL